MLLPLLQGDQMYKMKTYKKAEYPFFKDIEQNLSIQSV